MTYCSTISHFCNCDNPHFRPISLGLTIPDKTAERRRNDENHQNQDLSGRRIRECPLGACGNRCWHYRAWRDLLRRRRSGSAYSRYAGEPPVRPEAAQHRSAPQGDAQPAEFAEFNRHRIPCMFGDRHRVVGSVRQGLRAAGTPDAWRPVLRQDPRLQHLRRDALCPHQQDQAGRHLEFGRSNRTV